MVKIAVLVSGGGTNLQALLDAQGRGEILGGVVSLVVASRPDAFALTRAEQAGIPSAVLVRKDFADVESYSQSLIALLQQNDIGLVVLAGFMTIFSHSVTHAFENRILNIHPALIPAFCGKGFYGVHVHEAVLERGVKLTGATVHFVNEICDGGPIVLQSTVVVAEGDTPLTLQKRVMEEAEWKLLPQAVSLFCENRLQVNGGWVKILPAVKE